jgi:hypothetical protein
MRPIIAWIAAALVASRRSERIEFAGELAVEAADV